MEVDRLRTYLIEGLEEWVHEQRDIHLPDARPLSDEERLRFKGYFDRRILDFTRIATVDRISNPGFYSDLVKSGVPIPLDFTQAIGLALFNCVLVRRELWSNPSSAISTLFHEMVHVVQFDLLGPRKLIELYSDCLIQDSYHNVLFERQAYTLTDRFNLGGTSFSVRRVVEQELDAV